MDTMLTIMDLETQMKIINRFLTKIELKFRRLW